ncbi:MAG: helix-turn-helix transcriptional regulator [Mesorhizobium sp.]|nr:MAG: helix-turn-helix transcriptional regulator [Mesorhizobium sp.]
MAENNQEAAFNEALCARVALWRKEKGWTAEQMAIALGIPPDRYRKYESRSPLPAYLMERFCLICEADLENLLLGKARRRAAPPRLAARGGKR